MSQHSGEQTEVHDLDAIEQSRLELVEKIRMLEEHREGLAAKKRAACAFARP